VSGDSIRRRPFRPEEPRSRRWLLPWCRAGPDPGSKDPVCSARGDRGGAAWQPVLEVPGVDRLKLLLIQHHLKTLVPLLCSMGHGGTSLFAPRPNELTVRARGRHRRKLMHRRHRFNKRQMRYLHQPSLLC
jgi:hypothetical protein